MSVELLAELGQSLVLILTLTALVSDVTNETTSETRRDSVRMNAS